MTNKAFLQHPLVLLFLTGEDFGRQHTRADVPAHHGERLLHHQLLLNLPTVVGGLHLCIADRSAGAAAHGVPQSLE